MAGVPDKHDCRNPVAARRVLGKVVIGTVAGDIHDAGKSTVASMFLAAGFDVHDLGRGPVANFIDKLKQVHTDVVASGKGSIP